MIWPYAAKLFGPNYTTSNPIPCAQAQESPPNMI